MHLHAGQSHLSEQIEQRIDSVIKRRLKERRAEANKLAQKEAMGDYSHLKNKKGELMQKPLPQPTLPNLSVDDDFDDSMSVRTRGPAPSTYTQDSYYYNYDNKSEYPPPMPAFNPALTYQSPGSFPNYNQSQPNLGRDDSLYNYPPPQGMYDDDNESTAHLASSAAPFAHQSAVSIERPGTAPLPNPYYSTAQSYDPHDVYQGRAMTTSDQSRGPAAPQDRPVSGVAYDEAPDYYNQSSYGAPPAQSQYSHTGDGGYASQTGGRHQGGAGNYAV